MTGTSFFQRYRIGRLLLAAVLSVSVILPQTAVPAAAASERALYLYYTHTKETARIVFKRNGQYVQAGLNQLNQFLRDWRRNEPAKMDPRLFDLVWEVYQEVGASQPINVVSAYRSPATNAMLREKSSGVAENSQHIKGHAMDFFIPGVPLARLRATAMKKQVGGVGFYPTSGSPFVHLDTGSVRAWPRMTRAQLKEIFPDGRTMHLPTDGKPLSQQGYQVALAEWQKCHAYPCDGRSSGTQVADGGSSGRSLVDMLFGGGNDTAKGLAAPGQIAPRAPAPAPTPVPPPVQLAAATPADAPTSVAPIPAMRPAQFGGAPATVALASAEAAPVPALPFSTVGSAPLAPEELASGIEAPVPATKSQALLVATAANPASGDAVTALAAFSAPVPQPRLIMTDAPQAEVLTAYLPPMQQDSQAEQALQTIIGRQTSPAVTAALPTNRLPPLPAETPVQTASLGNGDSGAMTDLFRGTFGAAEQNEPIAAALAEHIARHPAVDVAMRKPDLIAPDLEHVVDVFLTPVALTSDHFADIWDHDEADFSPVTEMGRYVTVMGVGDFPQGLPATRFVSAAPISVAAN